MFKELFGSIRGLVFFLMAIAVAVGFFLSLVDPKDFVALVSMAFVAYFSRGRDTQPPIS